MGARRSWRLIAGPIAAGAFWTVFALVIATQTWLSTISHGHSLLRICGHQLAVWSIWAVFTVFLSGFTRRVPIIPLRPGYLLLHLVMAFTLASAHVLASTGLMMWIRPFDAMTPVFTALIVSQDVFAQLPFEFLIYAGVVALAHALDFRRRTTALEQSLTSARLHALELQLQPHFLFNTLNAISALVRAKQNAEAVEVIAGLSDLLRYTLDHAGGQRAALEEEAAILSRYLEIQQVRFPDRLELHIDIAADAARAAVPTLILQPLAENAIRHGVAQLASRSRIEVRAFRDDRVLRIEMFNSGALRDDSKHGIGLRNTIQRLQELYGKDHRFTLRNVSGGVLAEIAIPWSELA